MDTITHAISGAVIGAATSRTPDEMRRRALWGALFAAFPDTDAAVALFTDALTYLNAHRGYTHSVILLPAWAALLGWIASRVRGQRWRDMTPLAVAALAAHILGDLITSYGTRIFTPVYDAPLAFPITFIIDPVFTLILLAGLIAALWRSRPAFATASGVVLCGWLLLQVFAQQAAMRIGEARAEALGAANAPVIVFPQPLSPFNWKIVIAEGENYHRAYVNLLADAPRARAGKSAGFIARLRSAYQPSGMPEWKTYPRWPRDADLRAVAMAAWHAPAFEGFREFALLPYVTSMRGDARDVCVWFTDLRFTLPAMRAPFEYAVCRQRGDWALALDAKKQTG